MFVLEKSLSGCILTTEKQLSLPLKFLVIHVQDFFMGKIRLFWEFRALMAGAIVFFAGLMQVSAKKAAGDEV